MLRIRSFKHTDLLTPKDPLLADFGDFYIVDCPHCDLSMEIDKGKEPEADTFKCENCGGVINNTFDVD